jgi:hypothetical protein
VKLAERMIEANGVKLCTTAQVDWSDAESVIEYLVAYARVLAGPVCRWTRTRAQVRYGQPVRRVRRERARASQPRTVAISPIARAAKPPTIP